MRGRVLVIAGIAALVAATPARAATYTVTGTTDGTGDCSGTTCSTLRAAVTAADRTTRADTIRLSAATHALHDALPVTTDITVAGVRADTTAVAEDRESGRVFDVGTGGKLTVRHATLADGFTAGHGGDVRVAAGAQLVLDHVRVTGGSASTAGGIFVGPGASAQISHSSIDGNRASGSGGAIVAVGSARRSPVGITLAVTDSTVTGNTASSSAGIVVRGDARNITSLTRTTVAGNRASTRGGAAGVYLAGAEDFTVTGSIISGNTGDGAPLDCARTLTSGGGNVESGSSCGLATSTDRQNTNPGLGPLTAGLGETPVLPISPLSPAVDLTPAAAAACTGTDQRDLPRPQGEGCDAGAYEVGDAPDASITSGPSGTIATASATFEFSSTAPGATFECALDGPGAATGTFAPCTSPKAYAGLADGSYSFRVRAVDPAGNVARSPATRSFTVDTSPPQASILSGPSGATADSSPSFAFSAGESNATLECRLDGPDGATGSYGPCTSPKSFAALAPGAYTFFVRARDSAGNETVTSRSFTVEPPAGRPATATTQPPPPSGPEPRPRQTVVVTPVKGRVLIKLPGARRFVALDATTGIPLGSTVDTLRGRVGLSAIRKPGMPVEAALFYGGVFRVTQTSAVTQLRLVQRLSCTTAAKAADARRRVTKRRLWGSGKGRFRTRGRYSSATVRGTRWLVKDSCDRTLTRVARGVVAVRDFVRHRTKLVRAGHSYTARKR